MGAYSGSRWADERIMEEGDEELDGEEWEGTSTFTGSLPEQSYLSAAYRPTLPRMASTGSLSGRSPEPSLDGFQFPRPTYQYPERVSPAPSSARSASRTPTRPPPLNMSAADLGAPQVSAPLFHPSTPAYKLVSEIVSREALQRRTPGSQTSGSQPSTPQPALLGLPIARSTSAQMPRQRRRDSSADPPTPRRRGTLHASISVPQDIGKWIRSLEPRSSTRANEPPAAMPVAQEGIAPVPQRPKVISPHLPPSPPRVAVIMSIDPPSNAEEPVPLSRTITQLRAILSTQPAPEPLPAPVPKRPQFRPMTPQVASAVLTRPPPTPRSESTPPQATSSGTPGTDSPLPSPAPSAIRRSRTFRHGKHVSFSPTPTEIPSRATSPPPDDPFIAPSSITPKPSGWSLVNWLLPSQADAASKDTAVKPKARKPREEEELAGLWRARSWLQEERQGWNERMSESWQV
jgi:hypothetical protein